MSVRASLPAAVSGALLAAACAGASGPVSQTDPMPRLATAIMLGPSPWMIVRACRRVQAEVRFPVLCPTRLPRPMLGFPGSSPPALGSETMRISPSRPTGLDIGYGVPWESGSSAGWRKHLWRNRPCCFLHFVIARLETPVPRAAKPRVLGGLRGRLLPAGGKYSQGVYFGNHVRFFFRERGIAYVATLHTFGELRTEALLGRIVESLRPVNELHGGNPPPIALVGAHTVAIGAGGVWIAGAGDPLHNYTDPRPFTRPRLVRLDPRTVRIASSLHLRSRDLAIGAGALWLSGYRGSGGVVLRVDPRTSRVMAAIRTGKWPRSVAVGAGGVWVANSAPFYRRGTLVRIDPRTDRVSGTPIALGRAPAGMALAAGGVWVADALDGTVSRVDPARQRVAARIRVGRLPYEVVVGAGSVWVSNLDDGTVSPSIRGGTASLPRFVSAARPTASRPQRAPSGSLISATGLLSESTRGQTGSFCGSAWTVSRSRSGRRPARRSGLRAPRGRSRG